MARKCLREGRSHQRSAACSRKRETITTGHDVGTGCGRTERFSVSCQLLQAEKRKRKEELSELQSKQDALAQCEAQIKEIIHDPFHVRMNELRIDFSKSRVVFFAKQPKMVQST